MSKMLITKLTIVFFLTCMNVAFLFENDLQEIYPFEDVALDATQIFISNAIINNQELCLAIENNLEQDEKMLFVKLDKLVSESIEKFTVEGHVNELIPNEVEGAEDVEIETTVSLDVYEGFNTNAASGAVPALTWKNRNKYLKRATDCEKANYISIMMSFFDIPAGDTLISSTQYSFTDQDSQTDKDICIEIRKKADTLDNYMYKLDTQEDVKNLGEILTQLAQILSVFENLNIITGDLSEHNVLVFWTEEGGIPYPMIKNLNNIKFVEFNDKDIDEIQRYKDEYQPPEISKLTIRDEELMKVIKPKHNIVELDELDLDEIQLKSSAMNQSAMNQSAMNQSVINQSAMNQKIKIDEDEFSDQMDLTFVEDEGIKWEFMDYKYSVKEDNYAFAMICSKIMDQLSLNTNEDIQGYVDAFNNILAEIFTETFKTKATERMPFNTIAEKLEVMFGKLNNYYEVFSTNNQELINSELVIKQAQHEILAESEVSTPDYVQMINF